MIKRSVEQRADDGYIVDSLGWAYYRLGNMDEAVKQLERAVELKPEDLVKIEAKLKSGLPDDTASAAAPAEHTLQHRDQLERLRD